jgi:hypothetical protein
LEKSPGEHFASMKKNETISLIEPSIEEKLNQLPPLSGKRIRFGTYCVLGGFLIFLLGAKPELFGLDRSPVVGFVQITFMLVGLAIISLAGNFLVHNLWRGTVPSIASDLGSRIVSTGYVVALFSGFADIFGIGSQTLPNVPFFGVWQARGMEIGMGVIAIGFVMMFPYQKPHA